MSNAALAKVMSDCEQDPEQWNLYTDISNNRGHESTYATLVIRRKEQSPEESPLFDVAFMEQNTIEGGKTRKNYKAMTSKDLQDATGLNHAVHFKKQTGEYPASDADAIFIKVSPREVNSLARVNKGIAQQREAAYKTQQIASNVNFKFGIDSNKSPIHPSSELQNG